MWKFEEIMKGNVLADVGAVVQQKDFTIMDGDRLYCAQGSMSLRSVAEDPQVVSMVSRVDKTSRKR
jgi:hypothetical protein